MMMEEVPTTSDGPLLSGPHIRAIADVLLDLSLDIETLGTILCGNADVVQRHTEELQTIDLIAQKQRSLAAILQADCPDSAMSSIGVDVLRTRLYELLAVEETEDEDQPWQQIGSEADEAEDQVQAKAN